MGYAHCCCILNGRMNQKYQKLITNTNDDEPLNKKLEQLQKSLFHSQNINFIPWFLFFQEKGASKTLFFD